MSDENELIRTKISLGTSTRGQAGRPKTTDALPRDRVNFNKKDLDAMQQNINEMKKYVKDMYDYKLNKIQKKELENVELDVEESSEEEIIVKRRPKKKVIYLEDDNTSSSAPSEISTTTDTSVEIKKKKPVKKTTKKSTKSKPKKEVKKATKSKSLKKSKKDDSSSDSSSESSDDEQNYPKQALKGQRPFVDEKSFQHNRFLNIL